MATALAFTANEVAALSGLDEGRVRKEVEHGIFSRPTFTFEDLVYFGVLAALGVQLGIDDRRRLHDLVARSLGGGRQPSRVEWSPVLEVRVDRVANDARERLDGFEAWKRTRVGASASVLGGEATIVGTRLVVRHVGGMLLKGVSEAEVREDYPYLTSDDLAFARIFTRAYPRMGRPRDPQAAA